MKNPDENKAGTVRRLILELLPEARGGSSVIFGPGSAMDSLGLVNFLADLEFGVEEAFGRRIVIASERAMSRSSSPFRNVEALSDFVLELLSEAPPT
jgi:hypothetical protein